MELYTGRPENTEGRLPREIRTYDTLDRLGIAYQRTDHERADNMEACNVIDAVLGVIICKNLFLCNRQKTVFYLLMMPGDKKFKTKELSSQINSARLSFADPEDMLKYLDIEPGAVSVMGLMNDHDHAVQLLVDEDVLAGEYLGAMDLREYFAIVWPRPDYRHDRMYGFCGALEKLDKNATVFWGNADNYDQLLVSLERIWRMVDWNRPEPVGIFCDSDNTALTVNGYFQSHGIVVGRQIKLVGYDDLEQTLHTYPRLTTIRQPFAEMGSLAVRKLFNLMKGYPEKSEILEPELIIRESS